MNTVILIPAYNPDQKLIELFDRLISLNLKNFVVIDDGSQKSSKVIFDELQSLLQKHQIPVHILSHAVNLGKGRALKTALNYISLTFPNCLGVVTADADGQHAPEDILKVSNKLAEQPRSLVMGCRHFTGEVPFRSYFGNKLTSILFHLLVGQKLSDTQTGLRGVPQSLIPIYLRTAGEGYEFETNALIQAKNLGYSFVEVTIETIYIDQNRASHFNPILDSMRIYFLLLRFSFSSLLSSFVDFALFTLAHKFMGFELFHSLIFARIFASLFNYLVNKNFVFKNQFNNRTTVLKYYLLAAFIICLSYLLIDQLTSRAGVPVLLAKILTESVLFVFSFAVQREFVFKKKSSLAPRGS